MTLMPTKKSRRHKKKRTGTASAWKTIPIVSLYTIKPRTVAKRLEQLENLGINLVPLRKDFYLEQLTSLPLILELLEDDSTSFKLTSNGEIKW